MKALVILSLGLASTLAFANGDKSPPKGDDGPKTTSCTSCPEININAPSVQMAVLHRTAVVNKSEDSATARQNLASNSGNVTIDKASLQIVAASGSFIANKAEDSAKATQNLASNLGLVNVDGKQLQLVAAKHSFIGNFAKNSSTAVQNIASNNGCSSCN